MTASVSASTAPPESSTLAGTPLDVQLRQVRGFVIGRLAGAIAGIVFLAIVYAVRQPDWVFPLVMSVLFATVVLTIAMRLLRQRRLVLAVDMTAVSDLTTAVLAMVIIFPGVFAALAPFTIWPVLQAISCVDRTTLRRLVIGTVPVAVTALGKARRHR